MLLWARSSRGRDLAEMTPRGLARKIKSLQATRPITASYERTLEIRGIWKFEGVWYRSQKEHWLGWLSEYDGPGAYGRTNSNRSAEFTYNHINCAQMLFWLAEA